MMNYRGNVQPCVFFVGIPRHRPFLYAVYSPPGRKEITQIIRIHAFKNSAIAEPHFFFYSSTAVDTSTQFPTTKLMYAIDVEASHHLILAILPVST